MEMFVLSVQTADPEKIWILTKWLEAVCLTRQPTWACSIAVLDLNTRKFLVPGKLVRYTCHLAKCAMA